MLFLVRNDVYVCYVRSRVRSIQKRIGIQVERSNLNFSKLESSTFFRLLPLRNKNFKRLYPFFFPPFFRNFSSQSRSSYALESSTSVRGPVDPSNIPQVRTTFRESKRGLSSFVPSFFFPRYCWSRQRGKEIFPAKVSRSWNLRLWRGGNPLCRGYNQLNTSTPFNPVIVDTVHARTKGVVDFKLPLKLTSSRRNLIPTGFTYRERERKRGEARRAFRFRGNKGRREWNFLVVKLFRRDTA